jgi:hypothetical protein
MVLFIWAFECSSRPVLAEVKATGTQQYAQIQLFLEATADRIAGSPKATSCASKASTQMYQGIGS